VIDRDDDDTVRIDELLAAVEAAVTICHTKQPPVPTPTPTNPPGTCCCGSYSFVQCQELAAAGECFGWGDPCPTATSGPSADGATD
jgi:hypothetical protein